MSPQLSGQKADIDVPCFRHSLSSASTIGDDAMKNAKLIICVATATLGAIPPAQAQAPQAGDAAPVTVENFIRAESDLYLSAVALKKGEFREVQHLG